jgi:hypothetical protein
MVIMFPVYYGRQRGLPARRWIRILVITIVLIIALYIPSRFIGSRTLVAQLYPYIPFSNAPFVARLYVTKTDTNLEWVVHLSTIDRSGKLATHTDTLPQPCDQWQIKADVLNIQSWLALVLGVPSGWYRIIDIESFHCYSHGKVDASRSESIPVDGSTTAIMQNCVYGKLVWSNPLTSNSIGSNGKTYNAFITLKSLSLTPTG